MGKERPKNETARWQFFALHRIDERKVAAIQTLIDHIEFDEGRDPVADRSWEKI